MSTIVGYPELEDFGDRMYPRLELLLSEKDTKAPAYVEASRLLNTVCRLMLESIAISHFGGVTGFFKLYPIISQLESDSTDEELSATCTSTLAVLAGVQTLPKHVPAALAAVERVAGSSSWSARASSVQFLQAFLYHNMSTLLSEAHWIGQVRDIVLRLLKDERVEVRMHSSEVINGMIHCSLVSDREALLVSCFFPGIYSYLRTWSMLLICSYVI